MKGNKTIRIILGIVLLILLGIYLYLTGSARTNGKKFQELAAATPTVAPAETVQPEETPEYNFSDLQMSIYHTTTI